MKGRIEGTPDPEQQDGGAEDRNRHHQPDHPRITDPDQSGDGEDLSADPVLVRDALALLHPEGPWHVCAKFGDEGFRGKVEPDLGEAVDWAVEQNIGGRNVYVCFASLRAGWQGRKAKKEHVASVRWLWVDVDPRAREDLASERERIRLLLTERLPNFRDGTPVPQPTIVIDSGRGLWALWRLAEPVAMPEANDPGWVDAVANFEDRVRALEVAFGADSCHNIERVTRLPGTVNQKPGAGPARVLSVSDVEYQIGDFPALPKAGGANRGGAAAVDLGTEPLRLDSLDDLPPEVGTRTRMLIANGSDPDGCAVALPLMVDFAQYPRPASSQKVAPICYLLPLGLILGHPERGCAWTNKTNPQKQSRPEATNGDPRTVRHGVLFRRLAHSVRGMFAHL